MLDAIFRNNAIQVGIFQWLLLINETVFNPRSSLTCFIETGVGEGFKIPRGVSPNDPITSPLKLDVN
jgi:hypothetical protein